MPKVMLRQNASYTKSGMIFFKGKPKEVTDNLWADMPQEKFQVITDAPDTKKKGKGVAKKVTITKPAEKPVSIPSFRSKKELAEYAQEKHGIELDQEKKMAEMREDLVYSIEENARLKAAKDDSEKELSVAV